MQLALSVSFGALIILFRMKSSVLHRIFTTTRQTRYEYMPSLVHKKVSKSSSRAAGRIDHQTACLEINNSKWVLFPFIMTKIAQTPKCRT